MGGSRSRDRRSRDRRSPSIHKRSKELHRKRAGSRSRDICLQRDKRSRDSSLGKSVSPPATPDVEQDVMMTIADQLKRARAIADIESNSFVQQEFQTNYSKGGEVEEEEKFDFGTSAERKSRTEAEEAMQKLNR